MPSHLFALIPCVRSPVRDGRSGEAVLNCGHRVVRYQQSGSLLTDSLQQWHLQSEIRARSGLPQMNGVQEQVSP
jgi:hypothetical protein